MVANVYQPHHVLLRDSERTTRFRLAIEAGIKKGDSVIDLGSGTGIFGLIAARAGANKVISIERDKLIAIVATRLVRENGWAHVMHVHDQDSRTLKLDDLVDVIICDAMGFFGISEEMDAFFNARDKWLRPKGLLIPAAVSLYCAPVTLPSVIGWLGLDDNMMHGFRFEELKRIQANTAYNVRVERGDLLGEPTLLAHLDSYQTRRAEVIASVRVTVTKAGLLHGLAGWYSADLGSSVSLQSGPYSNRLLGRSRLFTIEPAVQVGVGDVVECCFILRSEAAFWKVVCYNIKGEIFHSQVKTSLASHPLWTAAGWGATVPGWLPAVLFPEATALFNGTEAVDARHVEAAVNLYEAAKRCGPDGAFTGI